VRKYESCYYELGSVSLSDEQKAELEAQGKDGIRIKVKVNKADEMNVYLYGGDSKFNATTPIVENND